MHQFADCITHSSKRLVSRSRFSRDKTRLERYLRLENPKSIFQTFGMVIFPEFFGGKSGSQEVELGNADPYTHTQQLDGIEKLLYCVTLIFTHWQ